VSAQTAELVTVLVPARNEEAAIPHTLEAILGQDYPNLEIVVVEGGSTDATPDVIQDFAKRDSRVRMVVQPVASIPLSLNAGLGAARGKWLVRVDAHSVIPNDYVSRLVAHLEQEDWGGVGGRKDAVAKTATGQIIARALGSKFGVGGSAYHHGTEKQTVDHIPFGAYRVDLLRSLGGWNEKLLVNEDFELDQRVLLTGRQLLLDPEIAIKWSSRETLGDLWRQYQRYGQGKPRVALLHPGSLRLRHLAPPILVASWAIAGLAALTGHKALAAAIVVPYAGAVTYGAIVTPEDGPASVKSKALLTAAFTTMHASWGVGFWQGALEVAKRGR
jgi:succinoglycan biosynthesis protein ExoA